MKIKPHNFWYAVNNTEIVIMPASHLETFGTTNLHYHLVSELMDTVDRIRVREGTIQSRRPEIITPTYYEREFLDGFGEQAQQYVDWLRLHAKDMRILQYGFKVQKTELSEQIVSGKVEEVLEKVKQSVKASADSLAAVIRGVDDPWDVCLLKFLVDVVRNSAPININELGQRHYFDNDHGAPKSIHEDIENSFLKASRNPSLIGALSDKLRKYGLFEEYEDRFFALVRHGAK